MRALRALLTGLLTVLFSGVLAVVPADATPTFYQFDNGKIRIGGNEAGESSFTNFGALRGPQYKSSDGNWYNLTIGNSDMQTAYGVGGDGTSNWNNNPSIGLNPVTNVVIDGSEFVSLGARGSGVYGYGTITVTGTMSIDGNLIQVSNRYTLEETASYLRVTSTLTNLSATTATNVRTWVGVRDDWIGVNDVSQKERGYLTSTSFAQSASSSVRSPAIKISTGAEGVLFYSTSPKANTSVSGCCQFSNAYNTNPLTNATSIYNDGSYALYVRMDDLAYNQSESYTWYYAAGEISTLTEIINQVAQATASWTDQTIEASAARGATYSDQVTASGTGSITYSVVAPSGTRTAGETTGLPPFVTLEEATGVLSGLAPSDSSADGTYVFRIQATAVSDGTTATSTSPNLTITVGGAPDISSVTSSTSATFEVPIDAISFADSIGFPTATYSLSSGSLPSGVTLNSTNGTVSGTPTATGPFTYRVTASNGFGSSQSQSSSMTVNRAPTFTGGNQTISSQGTTSSAYTASTVVALGYPTPTYSIASGSLPGGLSLDSSSGTISGSPSATGDFDFTIRATNAFGHAYTAPRSITIGSVPRVANDTIATVGYVAEEFNERPTFTGFPSPTFSIVGGELPSGLSLNSATGRISGTPTESGTFNFKVRATNFAGSVDSRTYSLLIHGEPVFDNANGLAAHATFGEMFSGQTSFHGAPTSYSIASSCGCEFASGDIEGLPYGLSINPSTGVVSGHPNLAGTYHFRIQATRDGSPAGLSSPLTIQVRKAPEWTDDTIALVAPLGSPFSDQVMASGYPAVEYSVIGQLPPGVTLNTTSGHISGTPTASGTYSFSIRASNTAGDVTTQTHALVVSQFPELVDDTIALTTLRNALFTDGISVTAYPAPTFSIVNGELPTGLTLNPNTGAITGTPTELGSYRFSVKVAATGYYTMTTPAFTLDIEQVPVSVDSTVVPVAPVGRNYSDAVSVESFPAATFSVTAGSLPPGLSVNATTGVISGTAREPGDYSFTITATNVRGSVDFPLRISAHEAPGRPIVTLAPTVVLGGSVSGFTAVTGYPAPTFFLAGGALPNGVSLDRATGRITGSPTTAGNFSFTIGALNDQGSAQSTAFSLSVLSPGANIDFAVPVGQPALGAPVAVRSEGLAPSVEYTITVRSTPQIVGTGTTTRLGQLLAQVKIPENLEPGWHSITLDTRAADGSPLAEVAWFEITATGLLETISESEPSASEKAAALTDDEAFYEKMGIDPGTQVEPEEVANTVQDVTSVVASVALVSAAAAATAAVASAAAAASAASAASAAGSAASAGGAASSSAGAARTATPGGSSSAGSSGGSSSGSARGASSGSSGGSGSSSGSSGSSGGSSGSSGASGDGGEESSDYGNLEAEHDDFHVEAVKWGDALSWWSVPFMTVLDRITVAATENTSRVSPVLSRIINDGAYLRAMIGGAMVVPYIASVVLGAASVDLSADSLASAGNVATLSIILVLGTVDALAGLLGIISFTVVSVSVFGIHSLGDIRYLLAMFIAGFAPIILSTTFRKIRRPGMETLSDVWERIVDVFMIAFVSSLTTLSVVGGISAFAGASVPLADAAKGLVFVITGVALARIILEEIAARSFAGRLDAINPTEVSGPGMTQQWVSLVFKYVVLTLMIGDMVGWGWWLWLGALIMFIPGIMGMTLTDLPKSKLLTQLIPGGLAALLLATLLSTWSGEIVGALFEGSDMYGPFAFLLVPLPVIIVAIVGMFAEGGEKWYVERNLKWVYVVGGIGVFASTIWATDFFGQIFG